MPDKALYQIAARTSKDVYGANIDLGTTEFSVSYPPWRGETIQNLSIAGTNEDEDWAKNGNLLSKKGIKKSAYEAAEEINGVFKPDPSMKLLVNGHSKGGAEAIAYTKMYGAFHCAAFAPARCLRYWSNRKMDNCTIFIDPDDPVSKVGFISFGLPICKVYKAKNDHLLPNVDDHFMNNWIRFVDDMVC